MRLAGLQYIPKAINWWEMGCLVPQDVDHWQLMMAYASVQQYAWQALMRPHVHVITSNHGFGAPITLLIHQASTLHGYMAYMYVLRRFYAVYVIEGFGFYAFCQP